MIDPAGPYESGDAVPLGSIASDLKRARSTGAYVAPTPEAAGEPHAERPPLDPPVSPPSRQPSADQHRLPAVAAVCWRWLAQPNVRLTITGLILVLLAGLVVTSSVWTLPLVVIGGLMIVVGWVGHRVDGRFGVRWGQAGTELEFRATVRAAAQARAPQSRSLTRGAAAADHEDAETVIVDGEAHTVEFDVEALKALVSAVETPAGGSSGREPSAPAPRTLRIAHGGSRASDTAG